MAKPAAVRGEKKGDGGGGGGAVVPNRDPNSKSQYPPDPTGVEVNTADIQGECSNIYWCE